MITWLLRALLFLIVLRLVLRFVMGVFRGLADSTRGSSSAGEAAPGRGKFAAALVRDPVCATYIPREHALTAIVDGETRYYCSDACRSKDAEARPFKPMGRAAHG